MTEGMGDQEKMIQPQDVAEAALLPLRTTAGATPKEVGLHQAMLAGSQGLLNLSLLLLSYSRTCGMPCRSPSMSQSPSNDRLRLSLTVRVRHLRVD